MSPTGSLLLALLAGPAYAEEVPPPDPDEELPDAAAPPLAPAPAAPTDPVPRVVLGVNVGAALPLSAFGPSVAPGIEGGVVLDAKGRYTALLGIGYVGGTASGTGADPALPDGYTWSVTRTTMVLAPTFRARLLPWGERIAPELSVGPLLTIGDHVASGASAGATFPETREARVGAGGFLAAGLVGKAGPGTLEGRVSFSLVHVDGVLTGSSLVPTLTPSIGYRVAR